MACRSGSMMAFRLIPREEKFYPDFQAHGRRAPEGRAAARGDARRRAARLGQGRRDQGSRAQVRLPDARDHPAPQPHVRHADRSRRHPRARPLARRRDGRDRRVGGRDPALPARTRPLRRARARAHHLGVHRSRSARRSPRSRQAQGPRCAHARRDQPARERSRPHPPAGGRPAVRRGDRTRSSSSSGRRRSTSSSRPPTAARTSPTSSRASWSSTASRCCSDRRRPDPRRARLRLHQRLSRRGQLDRDGRLDARAVAGQGRGRGRRSSTSSRRSASAPPSRRRSARA